ncbi:MAG TPA: penicillin acylase family protein [Vicinamibacterales bacterium]|nr:penicillin acylase family protein [Vicinamibacterales bacterium]
MRRLLRGMVVLLLVALVLIVGGGVYARSQVRASLAQLEGAATIAGLGADVRVERDSLGMPTIHAASREDVARALGFLHAQDRFFQMDLQRRQPAGELSALVGPRALDVDEEIRVHRFRNVAKRALELTEPSYRRILEAYAEGANAGLNALGAAPFEYLVLRATPEPWLPEDSLLTLLAMFNTLQGRQATFERSHGALRDTLPEPMFRFLSTVGSEWETPVIGSPVERPPIPGPEVFDLRNGRGTEAQRHGAALGRDQREALRVSASPWPVREPVGEEVSIIGSNNWAVDGAHSASGAAMVANDMHLTIAVPIIWYRASFAVGGERITGVTLPGIPPLVAGSNGHVAWGLTNTGGDWSDLVRIEPDPRDPTKYLTPEGPKAFDVFQQTIAAKGADSRTSTVRSTIWGPIVWKDARGHEYAQHWIAHDAATLSGDILGPERARSVDDLLVAIAGLGMPNQNVTMADKSGRIAWTIGGAIPRRTGYSGMTPASWADGSHKWDGYLTDAEFPRIVDPPDGRIWTANSPVVGDEMLATIGEGGFADGIRARLIRDRLMTINKATPKDMLDVQLDDRALYLERWRKLLLDSIPPPGSGLSAPGAGDRAEFRRLIDSTWTGRASPDSVAYRLVKEFRTLFVGRVMMSLIAPAAAVDPAIDNLRLQRGEGPVWQILTERPMHLLDPKYRSWDEAILDGVDATIAKLTEGGTSLRDRTWGEANTAEIRHPLAGAIPFFGRYLNMPGDPLPGDIYTPRASTPRTGPSERMVVSPGREQEGILHIPTGQSGHPLSPHYGDQYRAWLNGDATPFLPGATVTTLTLTPRK